MSNVITLERFAYSPDGTFGNLTLPDGTDFYTVERPWLGNKPYVSCIPEGTYSLGLRYSSAVKASTKEEFDEGWEVQDVINRTFIMLHPANYPIELKGCIGVGYGYKTMIDRAGNPRNGVTHSREAFRELMGMLEQGSHWILDIMPKLIQYP